MSLSEEVRIHKESKEHHVITDAATAVIPSQAKEQQGSPVTTRTWERNVVQTLPPEAPTREQVCWHLHFILLVCGTGKKNKFFCGFESLSL